MLAGRELALTATEHDLLYARAGNVGRLCSNEDLARRVRHRHVDLKLVRLLGRRLFGRRLRGQLADDAGQPVYILTARGVGYRLKPADR